MKQQEGFTLIELIVVIVILGFAIADFPHQSENAVPWLFAMVRQLQ